MLQYDMHRYVVEERLDILRRIIDRMRVESYNKRDSALTDWCEHLDNELELLKQEIENETYIP